MTDFQKTQELFAPHLIAAARRNFDAFVEFVGVDHEGHALVQHKLHRLMTAFEAWCYERRLYCGMMVPMQSGKTTQVELRAAFEIGGGADPTWATGAWNWNTLCRVVSASEGEANERAGAVRAIMGTDRYRAVFPGAAMVKGEESDTEFTLKRTGHSKDPTLGCSGVQTGTGSRCTVLLLDDIVNTRNAIQMPAERKKVTRAFEEIWMSRPTVVGDRRPRVIWIQTAYHVDDAAHQTRRRPDSGWAWLVVRAEPPYAKLKYEIWVGARLQRAGTIPTFMAPDELEAMAGRMGTISAARGLGQRPVSEGDQPFTAELFRGPEPLAFARYTARVGHMDPAGDAKKARRGDTDFCALVAVGRLPDKVWDVIYSGRLKGTPTAQVDWVCDQAIELGLSRLVVEAVADGAMPELVKQELRARGYNIPVERSQPRRNKEVRIQEDLEPRLRSGDLRIHEDSHRELCAELKVFPMGGHDDLADACAGAVNAAMVAGPARHASARRRKERSSSRRQQIRKRRYSWERGMFAPR